MKPISRSHSSRVRVLLGASLLGILAACAGPTPPRDQPVLAEWPALPDATPESRVYRVDTAQSRLRIRVDPAGTLARLGHSHVIGGAALGGRVGLDPDDGTAWVDLKLRADALEVDRPEWRREQDLKPDLEPDAVEGTRANMLSPKVLDAERHPVIRIRSAGFRGSLDAPTVLARIDLRGQVTEAEVPVRLTYSVNRLEATGEFTPTHGQLGLTPFSAAGGALRVAQSIRIEFRIVAIRNPTGS